MQKSWGSNELCGLQDLECSSVGGGGDYWYWGNVGRSAGTVVPGERARRLDSWHAVWFGAVLIVVLQ